MSPGNKHFSAKESCGDNKYLPIWKTFHKENVAKAHYIIKKYAKLPQTEALDVKSPTECPVRFTNQLIHLKVFWEGIY